MRKFEERIKRGIEAIARAKAEGKDTSKWENHLLTLITNLSKKKETVRLKMGRFGFCTCLLDKALCCGCFRVKEACTCEELEVDPEEEITRQYARTLKSIGTH
ncbi:MAG TPA: hypothetical protein VHT73_18785 [Thermodesulfobacteriota bacterium]|nr:hypothetical protein [Thermodesulfobacteriota bacterium]